MAVLRCSALCLLALCGVQCTQVEMGKNPIRKVVTLMQNMQKEVEDEGEKAKDLHEKFLCYCKGSSDEQSKILEDAKGKVDEFGSSLKAEQAEKTQIEQELTEHKSDREAAKQDLEQATSLREKEAGEFSAAKADSDTNIAAMAAAIPALEKGLSGAALLQVRGFSRVKHLIESSTTIDVMDRRDVLAFLQQSSGDEAPGSDQIVGILKQMKEEFEVNLKEAQAEEDKAVAGFAELKASKEKEIEVATESIESKMGRSGQLAVAAVQSRDGLEDSTDQVADTEKTLAALTKQCAAKEKEYAAATKDRADEVSALSQAISVLNDDDALDVFKKAVPASMAQVQWTGFLQRSAVPASPARKAQALLQAVAAKHQSPQLNLMLFTLKTQIRRGHGKSQKFEEIKTMIDDMIVLLGKQQDEDDKQKGWCAEEFDKSADEEAATKTALASVESSIEEMTDTSATLEEEIKALAEDITELDYTVAQATVQRKEEHAEYVAAVQMQDAAVALIEKAKGKLEKFYKPSAALVQKPPAPRPVEENADAWSEDSSFVQVRTHSWSLDDSEANDATVTKSTKGSGVVALMDSIIHDTQMAQKDSEFAEKTAQDDYADLMSNAQETRAQNSKSITDKSAAKAELEQKLVQAKENKAQTSKELLAIGKMIADLHGSCDFITENYGLRKEARANEADSLKNAKAVLSGANSGF